MSPSPSQRESFWTARRVNRLALTLLLSLGLAFAIGLFRGGQGSVMLFQGDFPAFYGTAVLAHEGRISDVYREEAQQEVQQRFWPELQGRYYAFSYPPFVAAALGPLGAFPPGSAKLLHGFAMLACLLGSLWLAGDAIPVLRQRFFPSAAAALTFAPILVSLMASQNLALSMLLFAGALFALRRDSGRGDFAAGVLLGLWAFKPNFGIPAVLFLAVATRRSFLAGAAVSLGAYYLLAAAQVGAAWPFEWLGAVSAFAERDFEANGHQMVSLATLAKSLSLNLADPSARTALSGLFISLGAALAGSLLHMMMNARIATVPETRRTLRTRGALMLAPVVLLLSPHTLFYDLGLIFFAAVFYFPPKDDRSITALVSCSAAVFALVLLRETLQFHPLAIAALAAAAALLLRERALERSGI